MRKFVLLFLFLVVPILLMAQVSGGQVTRPVKKQQTTESTTNIRKDYKNNNTPKRDRSNKRVTATKQEYCIGCKKYKPFTEFSDNSRRCKECSDLAREQEKNGYIDLGLPSGTLWATCNVGASKPEEYGDYFAWGETMGYKGGKVDFSRGDYKWWHNGYEKQQTKYNNKSDYGEVDNKVELDLEDDAAYIICGEMWRIPNKEQINELKWKCNEKKITFNGVNGWMLTGPNGNSIFLPAAGYRKGTELDSLGVWGFYWSRSLRTDVPIYAEDMVFVDDGISYWRGSNRYSGRSIRPVRVK